MCMDMKKRMSDISFDEWASLGPAAALEAREADAATQRENLAERFNLWIENPLLEADQDQASIVDVKLALAVKAGTVGRN